MSDGEHGISPEDPTTNRAPHSDPQGEPKGLGWLLLLPIACCGGPLFIGGIAAAGAAAAAGLGVVAVVIALAVTFVAVRRRRAASCFAPANAAPENGSVSDKLGKRNGPSG